MFKRELPSGKIQYGEWYLDPLTDKRKRVTLTIIPSGRKRADDRMAMDALRDKIRAIYESNGQSKAITLNGLRERYREYQARHVKPQTVVSNGHHINTLVRLLGEDTLAERLTAPYVAEKLDAPPTTYNERLRRFKAWIRWAYRMDYVSDIRYIDKLIPKKEESVRVKDAGKYLEHDEITALLDGMKVERWKLLTEFLILSGLRIGETIALEDKDIDDVIHVTKTFSMMTGRISTTKTQTSTRDVDIQLELSDCIKAIRTFVRKEEMEFGYRSKLFFPAFMGGYLQYAAYTKYLRENTSAILGRKLTPHALRHTHTAMLAEAGVPLETISRRLGHSNSKVTKEVYMHVTQGMREMDRESIKKVRIL